jgi:hypothetical protein
MHYRYVIRTFIPRWLDVFKPMYEIDLQTDLKTNKISTMTDKMISSEKSYLVYVYFMFFMQSIWCFYICNLFATAYL